MSVERSRVRASVPEWVDALSTRVGRVPIPSWDQNLTNCVPMGKQGFSGRIEAGMLGQIILAKSKQILSTISLFHSPARLPSNRRPWLSCSN